MKTKHPTFTDRNDREWTVHDFSVIAGVITRFTVGADGAAYRGFAPVDGGARRAYLFRLRDDRAPTPERLDIQFAESFVWWRDDPRMRERPERVDPGASL